MPICERIRIEYMKNILDDDDDVDFYLLIFFCFK